jgi:hypothetical protein
MTHGRLRPRHPHAAAGAVRSIFIFGYGSLIERASRTSTYAPAEVAFPVSVEGVCRGWFDQMPASLQGLSPTYLGAYEEDGQIANGVVYQVTEAELADYRQRETGYQVEQIEPDRIAFFDGRTSVPDGTFYYFATTDPREADEAHPIVQSYVDIVMIGALEQEAYYPLAQEAGFVQSLITQTTGWSHHWINDRVTPYRPFAAVPQAYDIDALLMAHFPFYPCRTRLPERAGPRDTTTSTELLQSRSGT